MILELLLGLQDPLKPEQSKVKFNKITVESEQNLYNLMIQYYCYPECCGECIFRLQKREKRRKNESWLQHHNLVHGILKSV